MKKFLHRLRNIFREHCCCCCATCKCECCACC